MKTEVQVWKVILNRTANLAINGNMGRCDRYEVIEEGVYVLVIIFLRKRSVCVKKKVNNKDPAVQ